MTRIRQLLSCQLTCVRQDGYPLSDKCKLKQVGGAVLIEIGDIGQGQSCSAVYLGRFKSAVAVSGKYFGVRVEIGNR